MSPVIATRHLGSAPFGSVHFSPVISTRHCTGRRLSLTVGRRSALGTTPARSLSGLELRILRVEVTTWTATQADTDAAPSLRLGVGEI